MYCPKLEELLHYTNDKIIARYTRDYPKATLHAEEALQEFMKFIWLCLKHQVDKKNDPTDRTLDFTCTIHAEMDDIDKMWHTFLLFTRDYQAFCYNYLQGNFFHHEPLTDDGIVDGEELTRYLRYIYDNLGKETVLKWFAKN